MNPGGPFTRYSLAGWVFVVVVGASVAFSSNQGPWMTMTHGITASGGNSTAGIVTAVLGIVAGVSAPPAIGYVLTRAAATYVERPLIWMVGRRRGGLSKERIAKRRVLFYSNASKSLIDWLDERTTLLNASFSCVLAGFAALLFAGFVLRASAIGVVLIVVIFGALLFQDALHSHSLGLQTHMAWDEIQKEPRSAPGLGNVDEQKT